MDEFLNRLPLDSFMEAPAAPRLVAIAVFFVILTCFWRGLTFKSRRRPWKSWPAANDIETRISDPVWQMQFVSAVEFEPQPLLNKREFQVLLLLEAVSRELNSGFRVMAQTSLGEILRPKSMWRQTDADLAYRSINSKRSDFVIVDRYGIVVLAVEYQGHGHYQGSAVQRDAVKREAFRSANVAFLEVPADFQKAEVRRVVRQILERSKSAEPRRRQKTAD
ncbi:DUF2726 domain-containing protein [Hyphomicrobium facile]|uniref:DUF2726 domain-containing protein n=1 Tax=Hyphomicrobium facile TaxID=51670 RepID=A0A1I7MTV2_9HYPH|nr:DUF2726 domain-containing protein [Hyphomicrobium facile]SFV25776.1 Protein of unknown function [Hyphomicrobium facile]